MKPITEQDRQSVYDLIVESGEGGTNFGQLFSVLEQTDSRLSQTRAREILKILEDWGLITATASNRARGRLYVYRQSAQAREAGLFTAVAPKQAGVQVKLPKAIVIRFSRHPGLTKIPAEVIAAGELAIVRYLEGVGA